MTKKKKKVQLLETRPEMRPRQNDINKDPFITRYFQKKKRRAKNKTAKRSRIRNK